MPNTVIYASKLATMDELVREVHSGDNLYVHSNAAVPLAMLRALCTYATGNLRDVKATHLLALGDIPYLQPGFADKIRHVTWFVGANAREAAADNRADYIPVFLGEIHKLIQSRKVEFDAVLIHVSPPDDHGYCSLGVDVTLCQAAIHMGKKVLAQVNPQMPRTLGESFVHLKHIDKLVEVDEPLPELPASVSSDVHRQIGAHVASLIQDGDCLQLGIGAIPDAVLDALRDRRDLGIHTEMFSNMAVELMQLGVINGEAKRLSPGKAVTAFVLGDRACYDFVHNNPMVEMRPVSYTNDPFNISRNDNVVAINGCLQVDLTGQVVSDNTGRRIVSGFGGQVDFIRGAARSDGGRPVIATPSTAKGGQISRIVAEHPAGYGVTTTRADVHWVATEHGIVDLFGLSRRERARALIELAHPNFRAQLYDEAGTIGLL